MDLHDRRGLSTASTRTDARLENVRSTSMSGVRRAEPARSTPVAS